MCTARCLFSYLYSPACILSFNFPRCIVCFVLAEYYFSICTSRFVFFNVYFPICIFRLECHERYFTTYISPNRIWPIGISDLHFPVCISFWAFRFSTPLHVLQVLDSFSSEVACSFYTGKKLHTFVRACDVCTFNVHFCVYFGNGFESKRIAFHLFHRWPFSCETLYII